MTSKQLCAKSCKKKSARRVGFPLGFVFVLLLIPALAWTWTGKVIRVIDGDSVVALRSNRVVEIRLFGIDCPEWKQAFSRKAREFTARILLGEPAHVQPLDVDKYGRTVCVVFTGGKNVNEALVRAGLAWVHPKCRVDYPLCSRWREMQKKAEAENIGLWRGSNPIPPWAWKRKKGR